MLFLTSASLWSLVKEFIILLYFLYKILYYYDNFFTLYFVGISEAKVSSKFQVTIPAWVRKELDIGSNCTIVWLEMRPGEITLTSQNKVGRDKNGIDQLCGIIKDNSWDSLKELKKYKKLDIEFEKRGVDKI